MIRKVVDFRKILGDAFQYEENDKFQLGRSGNNGDRRATLINSISLHQVRWFLYYVETKGDFASPELVQDFRSISSPIFEIAGVDERIHVAFHCQQSTHQCHQRTIHRTTPFIQDYLTLIPTNKLNIHYLFSLIFF